MPGIATDLCVTIFEYFSFTDGYVLSNRLHDHMEWKAANYYDPKNSRYLICFIDNLNMAKVRLAVGAEFQTLRNKNVKFLMQHHGSL